MYLIDTPPPTISGSLHIGHIFSYIQGDIIARYHKYLNNKLLYPFCIDNNGIFTEKYAYKNGIQNTNEIIDFSLLKGNDYLNTFKECDIEFTNNYYHTFSEVAIQTAYKAFEHLKSKKIIFKKIDKCLWSEKLQTSVSQFELDKDGFIEKTKEIPLIKEEYAWFINIKEYKKELQEQVDKINWYPLSMKKRIDNWIEQIAFNWCISRNRNYGIPIPEEPDLKFSTWFISSLSPQIAWNSNINDVVLNTPIFNLRFQAHDIINTWAFYTIATSYFLNNRIPWNNIMITGHVLDGKGNKFSKSSGNATNPAPFLKKYQALGLRHWSCSTTLGTDIKIDEQKMKMGWKIKNKFNNAVIFVNKQIAENKLGEDIDLLNIYFSYKERILKAFDSYDLHTACLLIYEFLWNNFCDIWIEKSKITPVSNTLLYILDDFKPLFNVIY